MKCNKANQRNLGTIYKGGVINASPGKLPFAHAFQYKRASVIEWLGNLDH